MKSKKTPGVSLPPEFIQRALGFKPTLLQMTNEKFLQIYIGQGDFSVFEKQMEQANAKAASVYTEVPAIKGFAGSKGDDSNISKPQATASKP